jgi:hypothetical protein
LRIYNPTALTVFNFFLATVVVSMRLSSLVRGIASTATRTPEDGYYEAGHHDCAFGRQQGASLLANTTTNMHNAS